MVSEASITGRLKRARAAIVDWYENLGPQPSPPEMPEQRKVLTGKSQDAPVVDRVDDMLNRWPLAKSMAEAILSTPEGWSSRVGLYGRWGTGKTSVLNFLQKMLEQEDKAIVVRFSAWTAKGNAGVLALLYAALLKRFDEVATEERALQTLKRGVGAIAKRLTAGLKVAEAVTDKKSSAASVVSAAASLIASFGGQINEWLALNEADLTTLVSSLNGRKVVVFVDDLDRADPRVLPQTLLSLREMLDWPNFTFVLAFDEKVIASALGDYSKVFQEDSALFLDKVVDVAFRISNPDADSMKRYVAELLKQSCPFVPSDVRDEVGQWFPPNARQAKSIVRFVASYASAAKRHGPAGINWKAVILQTMLRESMPKLETEVSETLLGMERSSVAGTNPSSRLADERVLIETMVAKNKVEAHSKEFSRLTQVIGNLRGMRATVSKLTVDYEMDLVHNTPAVTPWEVAQATQKWTSSRDDAVWQKLLHDGVAESGQPIDIVATEILQNCVHAYTESIRLAVDSFALDTLDSYYMQVASLLSVLESFWTSDNAIKRAGATTRLVNCFYLLDRFREFEHFDRNEKEVEIRARERSLLIDAIHGCEDQAGLYFKTMPQHFKDGALEGQPVQAYYKLVQDELGDIVATLALDWFTDPGRIYGIAVAGQSDGRDAWTLESLSSPLYRDEAVVRRLVERLAPSDSNDSAQTITLAKSATDYLGLLTLELNRGATYMADLGEFIKRHPDVVEAAWRAATAVTPQYRARHQLVALHKSLVKRGMDAARLVKAQWMLDEDKAGELDN